MRAVSIVRRLLEKSLSFMHAKRRDSFWCVVGALVLCGRLSVTGLGRAARGRSAPKHAIKKVDRLLSNRHLRRELPELFRAQAHLLIGKNPRPVILVDWTPVGVENLHWALVASVPLAGRALVVYAEVHPQSQAQKPRVERRFLRQLKAVLPDHCRPVLVTDAGFRMPWFDAVRKLEWGFVGRLTSYTSIREPGRQSAWFLAGDLHPHTKRQPTDFGTMEVRRSGPRTCRVVLAARRRSQGRKRLTRRGRPSRRSTHKYMENRARQPWVLATSLEELPASRVLNLYRLRMQIEETFRDLKSHRFGWSFEDTRSASPQRLQVLLLIAAFAALVTILVGYSLELAGLHRLYQANTIRKRRVLSIFFLGKTAIERRGGEHIPVRALRLGLRQLRAALGKPLELAEG